MKKSHVHGIVKQKRFSDTRPASFPSILFGATSLPEPPYFFIRSLANLPLTFLLSLTQPVFHCANEIVDSCTPHATPAPIQIDVACASCNNENHSQQSPASVSRIASQLNDVYQTSHHWSKPCIPPVIPIQSPIYTAIIMAGWSACYAGSWGMQTMPTTWRKTPSHAC